MKEKFIFKCSLAVLMSVALIFTMSFGSIGAYAETGTPESFPEAGISLDSSMSENKTWKAGNGTIKYVVQSGGARANLILENADIKVSEDKRAITLPASTKVKQIILEGENTITTETGSALICVEAVSIVNAPEKSGGKLTLETTKDRAANAFLAEENVNMSGVEVVVKRAKHSNLQGNEE